MGRTLGLWKSSPSDNKISDVLSGKWIPLRTNKLLANRRSAKRLVPLKITTKKQRPYFSLRNQNPHSETNLSVFLCERNIPQRSVTSLRIPATSHSRVAAENYERCSLRCSRKKSTPHHGLSARSSTLCDANDVSQKKVVLFLLSVFFRSQNECSVLSVAITRPTKCCVQEWRPPVASVFLCAHLHRVKLIVRYRENALFDWLARAIKHWV